MSATRLDWVPTDGGRHGFRYPNSLLAHEESLRCSEPQIGTEFPNPRADPATRGTPDPAQHLVRNGVGCGNQHGGGEARRAVTLIRLI